MWVGVGLSSRERNMKRQGVQRNVGGKVGDRAIVSGGETRAGSAVHTSLELGTTAEPKQMQKHAPEESANIYYLRMYTEPHMTRCKFLHTGQFVHGLVQATTNHTTIIWQRAW